VPLDRCQVRHMVEELAARHALAVRAPFHPILEWILAAA
jgi:hypothetical protein